MPRSLYDVESKRHCLGRPKAFKGVMAAPQKGAMATPPGSMQVCGLPKREPWRHPPQQGAPGLCRFAGPPASRRRDEPPSLLCDPSTAGSPWCGGGGPQTPWKVQKKARHMLPPQGRENSPFRKTVTLPWCARSEPCQLAW